MNYLIYLLGLLASLFQLRVYFRDFLAKFVGIYFLDLADFFPSCFNAINYVLLVEKGLLIIHIADIGL